MSISLGFKALVFLDIDGVEVWYHDRLSPQKARRSKHPVEHTASIGGAELSDMKKHR